MKRLFLLSVIFLFAISVFAQDYGVNYTIASPSSKARFFIPKYSTLKVISTHNDYSVLKDIPAGTLISTAIADLTWVYPVGSATSSTVTTTTLTATTATITAGTITTATLGGKALTRKDANGGTYAGSLTLASGDTLFAPVGYGSTKLYSPSVTASTTFTMPGTTTMTRKDANGVTLSHSLTATDTLFAAVVSGSTKVTSPSVVATTTFTMPGTTTLTRKNANGVTASHSITATDTLFAAVASTSGNINATGNVVGAVVGVSGTDTVSAAPVGTICYRAYDSTLYLKIKLTGPKSARWMKVTVGK